MSQAIADNTHASDAWSTPLADIDVSRSEYYGDDSWRPYFARLRQEDPVHYCREQSQRSVLVGDAPRRHQGSGHEASDLFVRRKAASRSAKEMRPKTSELDNFIAMDEPRHSMQRKTVAPSVAPTQSDEARAADPRTRHRHSRQSARRRDVQLGRRSVRSNSPRGCSRCCSTFRMRTGTSSCTGRTSTTASPQLMGDAGVAARRAQARTAGLREYVCATVDRTRGAGTGQRPDLDARARRIDARHDVATARNSSATSCCLIVGGNDTTRNTISGGVLALNESPDQYQKLRENLTLIPNMVAEMVRWQTSVIHMRRTALRDTELGGKQIREGDKVIMWYLSGNRDEAVFDECGQADHRSAERARARVVRLRRSPLHGQPARRDAAARVVGRDHEALPHDRSGRRREATSRTTSSGASRSCRCGSARA